MLDTDAKSRTAVERLLIAIEILSDAFDGLIEHYDSQPNDWYRMFVYSSADEILSRFDAKLQGKQPFLGFINLIDSHDPYFPKPERYDLAKDGPKLEGLRYRTLPPELADPESIADPDRKAKIKALIQII